MSVSIATPGEQITIDGLVSEILNLLGMLPNKTNNNSIVRLGFSSARGAQRTVATAPAKQLGGMCSGYRTFLAAPI